MKRQRDDLAVLRKKFEEVDAIVRDRENRLAQFREEFLVEVALENLDAAELLVVVKLGVANVVKLGHTTSLIEEDLTMVRDGLGECQRHGSLNLESDNQKSAEKISIDFSPTSIDSRNGVIGVFNLAWKVLQARLIPYRVLRDRYQEELKSVVAPLLSRDQQIKVRNRLAKKIRKENLQISWSELAVRVQADSESQGLTVPINKDTVRQPFKASGTRGQAKPVQPQKVVKQKNAGPHKRQ